jgi:DNA-binding Lrp family transcriptional regulator
MTERQELDAIDLRILSELQNDGRIRTNELAVRVGVSHPSCLRRVRALRGRGVITAIRATLDERQLGYEVVSFVSIQLASQAQATLQAFENSIAALPLVQQCWRISGKRTFYSNASRQASRACTSSCSSLRPCPRSETSEASRCLAYRRMRHCRYRDTRQHKSPPSDPWRLQIPSGSRARRAGMRNYRNRRPAGAPKPSVRSAGRECPCARNRPPRLPWCRSEA